MSEKIYVLYHGGCYDGFGAAWAARNVLKNRAEYIPVAYGKAPPEMEDGALVYIVDFSYPLDVLQQLAQRMARVVVLDHHKTAEEALRGLPPPDGNTKDENLVGIFDMKRSGAGITWDFFNDYDPRPAIINWIEDRDLWRFDFPESKAFHAYIKTLPWDFATWDDLDEDCERLGSAAFRDAAEALLRQEAQMTENIARFARMGKLAGHDVVLCNGTSHWSELGHFLCKKYPEAKFAAVYYQGADQGWKWSLRSIGDFDVSAVAKSFGGGGHKNAAGFSTEGPIA